MHSSLPIPNAEAKQVANTQGRPTAVAIPTLQNANYATLREIEGRLKSIKNIAKITKTMKIVASTKLTKAQKAMEEAQKYGKTSQQVFDEAETKPAEDSNEKTLLIVASSDKGLCGGVHSGLTRAARKMMNDKPGEYDIVVLGEKCKAQLSRSNAKQLVLSFSGVGRNVPTFADAQAVADRISLLPTDYKDIKILYNKFINAQSYNAVTIEAYNEEAIRESRMSSIKLQETTANIIQPILHSLKSTTKFSAILRNTHLPMTSFGPLPKATPLNNLLAEMPWTMHPRMPTR